MSELEFNPVANIFPLMQGAEYNQLKDDITANGLLDPIWLDTKGKILDGRNRYRVCLDVGVEPQYRTYEGSDELKFVISKNLHRRHLSESQRTVVAERLANMQRGGDRPSENDSNFDSANLPIGNIPQSQAAEMLNVSERGIRNVKAIERDAPELIERIESGEITIHEAQKEIKLAARSVKVEAQKEQIKSLTKLDGLYDVIVIDPPWQIRGDYDPDSRRATPDYPMMSYAEIADIEIPASDNCILWLWVTNLDMHEGFHLVDKWGFDYKNTLTWAKNKFGLGVWMRGQTEHCLLAVKGKPLFTGESISTLLSAPTSGHSIKPDAFYELVDKCCYGRKLDYFGGKERDGWDRYGAQRVSL